MRLPAAALMLAVCCAPGAALAQAGTPAPPATGGPFTFTIPPSRVVVKVADTSLRPSAMASSKPNYFKLERANPLLIVSGWLEPAAGYKGLDAFWQSERRSSAYAEPLAPTRIEMLHDGRWEVVAFDVPLPRGAIQSNLRAERVEAGTWVDLHLSTVSTRPSATVRAELLAVLRAIDVREKAVTPSP